MNGRVRRAILLILGCWFAMSQAGAEEQDRVLLVTGEWPPYASEEMEQQGFFTTIISAAFRRMGREPDYEFMPWKRGVREVQHGRAFATFPYIITPERQENFDFSDPVVISTGRLFYHRPHLKQPPSFQQLSDLKPYRIGGILGYWYEKPFKEAGLDTYYVTTEAQSVQQLALGRVQLAAMEEWVGWAVINRLYPQQTHQFAMLPQPLNQDPVRLMVSRRYPEAQKLLQAFNQALGELKASGEHQRILERFGIRPFSP